MDFSDSKNRIYKFSQGTVTTDTGCEVSITDDDYEYWKSELENKTNPLSDDYNKYDNE